VRAWRCTSRLISLGIPRLLRFHKIHRQQGDGAAEPISKPFHSLVPGCRDWRSWFVLEARGQRRIDVIGRLNDTLGPNSDNEVVGEGMSADADAIEP
jgi:hypothetical protein